MILSRRFQCDAAGVGGESCHLSTGSPSLCSGITRGYAWCASSGGGSVWMREQRWESGSGVRVSARPYTVCGDGGR